MKLTLAQVSPLPGDVRGNAEVLIETAQAAEAAGSELVVFPQLALTGAALHDLAGETELIAAVERELQQIAERGLPPLLLGAPWRTDAGIGSALLLVADGRVQPLVAAESPLIATSSKSAPPLPVAGKFALDGHEVAVVVAPPDQLERHLREGERPDLLIASAAQEFVAGRSAQLEAELMRHAQELGCAAVFCNLAGGAGELIFAGGSAACTAGAPVAWRAACAHAETLHVDFADPPETTRPVLERPEEIWAALTAAISDYVTWNGFPGVIVGNSGGIDSALVLTLAVDAVGPERVTALTMPSRFTSSGTHKDAGELARRLGCRALEIAIEPLVEAFDNALAPTFAGRPRDVTEENLQARTRANLLMACSNKFGDLVLVTSNKSESAVGYGTLYGDMAGGFAPIKDLLKTEVYELARWRNAHLPADLAHAVAEPLPPAVLTRAPSAELSEGQSDEATLGSYEQLDTVITAYVDRREGIAEIVAAGHPRAEVERIVGLVDRAEHKRRQSAPGPTIGGRGFAGGRRFPLVQRPTFR